MMGLYCDFLPMSPRLSYRCTIIVTAIFAIYDFVIHISTTDQLTIIIISFLILIIINLKAHLNRALASLIVMFSSLAIISRIFFILSERSIAPL